MKRSFLMLAALSALVSCTEKIDTETPEKKIFNFTVNVKTSESKVAAGATVDLFLKGATDKAIQSKVTDEAGAALFVNLLPGEYLAKAGLGNEAGEATINITTDEQKSVAEIVMKAPEKKSHDFKVTLKSHRGQILPNRKVEVSNVSNEVVATLAADAKGEVIFKSLVEGKYFINVLDVQENKTETPATEVSVVSDEAQNNAVISVTAYLHNPDIIIIGAMVDPRGTDSPADGKKSYDLVHPGTYEYVQFMALKDIDFAKTPYAVITGMCSSKPTDGTYGTTGNGWVEGIGKDLKTTYQMNLTTGSVKAGQIFYVGGTSQVIASYFTSKENRSGWLSPRIEDSRWWAFDYYNKRGDNDNGKAKGGSGLFNNLNSDKKGNVPDGIAVFNTTNVDKTTVPIDCVFYGGADQPREEDKFMICDNDLYSTVAEDGTEQKHFGEGSNVWFMKQDFNDKGCFFMMGGTWCNGEWLTPRVGKAVMLNVEAGPESVTVDMIETAEGVTKALLKK